MDCITFTHGFKQGDDGDWEADPSIYEVDGKWYRRSGAHYSLAFDFEKGGQYVHDKAVLECPNTHYHL